MCVEVGACVWGGRVRVHVGQYVCGLNVPACRTVSPHLPPRLWLATQRMDFLELPWLTLTPVQHPRGSGAKTRAELCLLCLGPPHPPHARPDPSFPNTPVVNWWVRLPCPCDRVGDGPAVLVL